MDRAVILLAAINAKWIHPSLALRLLKANLGDYAGDCAILEFALRQPLDEKLASILSAAPRILGLSVSIWNHTATVELLRALTEGRREGGGQPGRPLVVLGGPEASFLPEDAELFRYADYVIRGEGEEAFRGLCGFLLRGEGPGPGKFIDAKPLDPGTLKSAYGLYTGEDLRRKLVYVEASRGCPFGCEFCLSPVQAGGVREFPLEAFLADMEGLLRRGARIIKFLDRTFNLDMGRAARVLEFFLDALERFAQDDPPGRHEGAGEPPFCVHFEMVPSGVPVELREPLRRFPPGSLRLELGIQTFNAAAAALAGRRSDPAGELETLAFLSGSTNAILHVDLIAGLPGEDLASFGRGFDRLWQVLSAGLEERRARGMGFVGGSLRAGVEIQPGILKRLPGTPIGRHDRAYGMRYAPDPPYEVLETAALPQGDLERLKNFARFWELIMNRGHFPETAPLFPPGAPVFDFFMALSGKLLARFGRNWGIDRRDLQAALFSQTAVS
jgi:hypothetical protein